MDPEKEENEVKNETENVVTADSSNQEVISPNNVIGHEGVPAGILTPDQESMKVTEEDAPDEEAATSEPEESGGHELAAVSITPTEDSAVKINDHAVFHQESVVFEINGDDGDDGPPRLHLETPEGEEKRPTQQEEGCGTEGEEPAAAHAEEEDISHEEHVQLLQELREERDKASRRSSHLQMKLAEYFANMAGDDGLLERELPVSEQLQEYEKNINILRELKQQLNTDSATVQQQAEELSLQCQEKQDEVENEWRAFMAQKQDVAVSVLSRRLGKQAARAKVESILAAEQLRHDELIELRLKNIKLKIKIQRLEAKLRDRGEHILDPLQVQYEQLQAERLELKKRADKQKEESLKMQKKISSSLELLSNIKEKLFWSQAENQAKREQLAEVEATVARKRDLLTRTKQARNSLQRDNLRLKQQRGLLGNRVLMEDFESTVDASEHLEERLEKLKDTQAEIVSRCGRWKKRLETTQ